MYECSELLFVLFLSVLCEEILDLGNDIGRSLYQIGDLIHGIGLALLVDADKLNGTVTVDNEESDGGYGQARSTAASKVLGAGLSILLGSSTA